jgi:ribosomal protein L21
MKYAIIENGGKQYRAVEGSTIEVDRLDLEIGEQVDLSSVLCWSMVIRLLSVPRLSTRRE